MYKRCLIMLFYEFYRVIRTLSSTNIESTWKLIVLNLIYYHFLEKYSNFAPLLKLKKW